MRARDVMSEGVMSVNAGVSAMPVRALISLGLGAWWRAMRCAVPSSRRCARCPA